MPNAETIIASLGCHTQMLQAPQEQLLSSENNELLVSLREQDDKTTLQTVLSLTNMPSDGKLVLEFLPSVLPLFSVALCVVPLAF